MHSFHGQTPQNEKPFGVMLDCICSDLFNGSNWHLKAGNEMRKLALRGFGRMHDYNANYDFCKRIELEKIICDRLGITVEIDTSAITAAVGYNLKDPAELKNHLHMWMETEKAFAAKLTEAVRQAAAIDMCVYNELICILSAVQEEIMRIKLLKKRLELGGYNGHDLARISKDLHEHYEHHADLGMDVNLG
jgi:hypothetical protein